MTEAPKANVKKQSKIPFFWIVPVIALAISGWLVYDTIKKGGIEVEIEFEDASGLQPGKTDIRYNGVKVGTVQELHIREDLKAVMVTGQLDESAAAIAREGAKFWIVRPNLGVGGISGIETLISGNFISVTAGTGSPAKSFKGLEVAPAIDPASPDLFLKLESNDMPQVTKGSPVKFRDAVIGEVIKTTFDYETYKAIVDIRIRAETSHLVREGSLFWDSSGLDISLDLNAGKLKSGSLLNGLLGSISMVAPRHLLTESQAAVDGDGYTLYADLESLIRENKILLKRLVEEEETVYGLPIILRTEKTHGLNKGAEVRMNGLKVGEVLSLQWNPNEEMVNVICSMVQECAAYLRAESKFYLISPQLKLEGFRTIRRPDNFLEGNFIELVPGSGEARKQFDLITYLDSEFRPSEGLRLILRISRLGKIQQASPVYYRGIQVGQIEEVGLADDGTAAEMRTVIFPQYARLVRKNTRFWNASGIRTNVSLMGGIQLDTTSFESVLEGAIAFATPDNDSMGPIATDDAIFEVSESAEENWLEWKPRIPIETSHGK